MSIGFALPKGIRATLSCGESIESVDRWGEYHQVTPVIGGRINVTDRDIALPQVRRRPDGRFTVDLVTQLDRADVDYSTRGGRKGVLQIEKSPQAGGWGTGEHYLLPTDKDGNLKPEPGRNHIRVYISGSETALSRADIAADAGVAEASVVGSWLVERPQYHGTEETPVSPAVGLLIANYRVNGGMAPVSDWYLFERGYSYGRFISSTAYMRGEDPLHPLLFGAWGNGANPKTEALAMAGNGPSCVVFSGLDMHSFEVKDGIYVIVDDITVIGEGNDIQNTELATLRRAKIRDVYYTQPVSDPDTLYVNGEVWNMSTSRHGAIYSSGQNRFLLEQVYFDHSGWNEGYDVNASASFPQPPSGLSHNIYFAESVQDVTLRDFIMSRGASFGAQMRGGATVRNGVFLDNNIAADVIGGNYKNKGHWSPYSQFSDVVVTSNLHAKVAGSVTISTGTSVNLRPSAMGWGLGISALYTSVQDTIICHSADPENPDEIAAKTTKGYSLNRYDDVHPLQNVVVYGWNGTDRNVGGLAPAVLDVTTIQRHAGDLLGTERASIEDFVNHTMEMMTVQQAVDGTVDFFKRGFGQYRAPRTEARSVTFVPDPDCDGFRWDTRHNWDSKDIPGLDHPDTVDLDGSNVMFGLETAHVAALRSGGGTLSVSSGRLSVDRLTDDLRAIVKVSGQLFLSPGARALSAHVSSGRLNLTGPAQDLDIRLGGTGQVLLGPDATIPAGRTLTLDGLDCQCGWDATGSATLTIAGTVRFLPGVTVLCNGLSKRRADAGQPIAGDQSGFSGRIGRYEQRSQHSATNRINLYDLSGRPETGETACYATANTYADGAMGVPTPVEYRTTIGQQVDAGMPAVKAFRSGLHGLSAPTVQTLVVLEAGAQVMVDTAGLAAGSYDLIVADSIVDKGAALPDGVSIVAGRVLRLIVA